MLLINSFDVKIKTCMQSKHPVLLEKQNFNLIFYPRAPVNTSTPGPVGSPVSVGG
jgi:hypothetical protein